MGGSLPVMVKFLLHRHEEAGSKVGKLYFVNTLGAAAGALLAGFALIALFGLRATTFVAAAINLGIGTTAFILYRKWKKAPSTTGAQTSFTGIPEPARVQPTGTYSGSRAVPLLVGYGLAGFAALGLEVLFTRALIMVIGSSIYAFSLIVAAFLVGIALGSLWASSLIDRKYNLWISFAVVEIGVGLGVLTANLFLGGLPLLFGKVFDAFPHSFWILQLLKFLIVFVVLLIPTILMGAAFPVANKLYIKDLVRVSRSVGYVYAANTLGAVVGPIAAAFLLIPLIGIQHAILALAYVYLIVGAWILVLDFSMERTRKTLALASLVIVAGLALLTPGWNKLLMSSGVYYHKRLLTEGTLLFYKEGKTSTVAVVQHDGANKSLVMNGKVEASSLADLHSQLLLGHMAMLWHENPRRVLVVGFGSGISTGAILRHREVENVDVVDIEPVVIEANVHFADDNHRALRDPRLQLYIDDARHHVSVSPENYDVIAADAFDVWVTGSSNLWTKQTFELYRRRLRDNGIFIQWLPMYAIDERDLKIMIQTFRSVFPYTLVWSTKGTAQSAADLLVMGSPQPLRLDFRLLRERLNDSRVQKDLERIGSSDPHAVLSYFLMDEEAVRVFSAGAPINTDNHPRLEFSTPKFLYADHSRHTDANFRSMWPYLRSPLVLMTKTDGPESAAKIEKQLRLRRFAYKSSPDLQELAAKGELELEMEPKNREARNRLALLYNGLGLASMKSKQFDDAAKSFKRASQLRGEAPPNLSQIAISLGRMALDMRRPDEAIHHFTTSLELNPNAKVRSHLSKAHYLRAVSLKSKGKTREALGDFQRVIDLGANPEEIEMAKNEMQALRQ
jgi:spermidine synthase